MKNNGLAWFNIAFGALLYIGAFYVSYAHTLDLMHRGHYINQYAHITTLVGEGVFVIGMVNLVVLQIKNKKVRFYEPPRVALWVGLAIVGYSNWSSGLGKGYESIAIGLGIVVVMWVAEAVISYGIKETRQMIEVNNADTKTVSDIQQDTAPPQTIARQDVEEDKTDIDTPTMDVETDNEIETTLSLIQGGKTDKTEEAARQMALDYYDTHGKYPSYRDLGEMSGLGKDRAGKVIKQLKTRAV